MRLIGLMAFGLQGCAVLYNPAGAGLLYADVKHPGQVVDPDIPRHMRMGEACSFNILGLFTAGDSSALTATLSADIEHIRLVEQRSTNVFLVFGRHCTVVWGD